MNDFQVMFLGGCIIATGGGFLTWIGALFMVLGMLGGKK